MNREDIIKLAREANIKQAIETPHLLMVHELARFAALVAAAEREKFKVHAAALVRDARHDATEREREECAKVCDGWLHADGDQCAAAIRARGEK